MVPYHIFFEVLSIVVPMHAHMHAHVLLAKGGEGKKLLVHVSCSLQKMVGLRSTSSSQIWGEMVGMSSEAKKSVGMLECSTLFP